MKQSPSVWRRFGLIFRPDFIERVIQTEEDSGKTWGFWFLSNTVITLVITVSVAIFLRSFLPDFLEEEIISKIPQGAEIRIEEGLLITENIPDPVFYETSAEQNESFVFILDTKSNSYEPSVLDTYEKGVFINQSQIIIKEDAYSKKEFSFTELTEQLKNEPNIPTELVLNEATIHEWIPKILKSISTIGAVIMFFILWFVLCIIRLVSALFWALLFWVIGSLAKIKDWGFEKSFNSVLHFKLITILLLPAAMLVGLGSFWCAFIILGLLFGMNFWHIKKSH